LRLVKAGYGTVEDIRKMTSREVIQAINYEKFIIDYEEAYIEMNKE
jgi:hypothetical protein